MSEKQWYSPRRKRFWVAALVLVYTLLGFFAAPRLIKASVIGLFQNDIGRLAHIEKVEVNPFVLSLRVSGFELFDTDKVRLASFDEFFVNFQLSSLFHWAWTFRDVQLTAPYFYFERYETGESRLDQFLTDFAKSQQSEANHENARPGDGGAPRLLIQNLELHDGHVDAKDNVPGKPFETRLAPNNISISELNTLPNRRGEKWVTIRLPDDASLKWEGSLTLNPLASEGQLVLEGLRIAPVIAYLEAILPLEYVSAVISSRFQYRLHRDIDGFDVDLDQIELELDDLMINGLDPVTNFIDIPRILLQGGKLRYPEQTLTFSQLGIERPRLSVWVNENGSLSVMDLVTNSGGEVGISDPEGIDSAWQLGIDELLIEGGRLAFADRRIQPAAEMGVTSLFARLTGISNAADIQMPLEINGSLAEGGSYHLVGKVGVLPAFSISANAAIQSVPLTLIQPYIQQYVHVAIVGGVIESDLKITLPAGESMSLGGSIVIPGLKVNDTINEQSLLTWEKLDIDQFDLNTDGLNISQVTVDRVYGRLVVNEDQTTNVSKLVVDTPADREGGNGSEPLKFIVGGIRVNDGSMDFSDYSLPLPFATYIANLDGTISTIDASSDEPANIRLEGQVDEYGMARIEGTMNVLDPIRHTGVTLEFRNLLMSSLSPYSVQFAGREIDEGKLDLGLVYAIDEGRLNGENDLVLRNLVLGDEVDHPDASSLPLGLAVSLLKDANGIIEIELPVEGDINDPEFQIGGVIWQAFSGLITKIVTAPFRLLGNLIGVESQDLGQFEFIAGRADLTPPELEKIVQLGEALRQRPELVIEVSGVTDPEIDIPAMKFMRLRSLAFERMGEESDVKDDADMMLNVEIRATVETLFTERFPDVSLESVKTMHFSPADDDAEGKPVFDELAYATDLWKRLLDSEEISKQNLAELANARAEAIKTAFLADDQFDASRIVISKPTTVTSDDGEWVRLELAIASG